MKFNTPLEELCTDLPEDFANLIRYTRSLRFEEKPDYAQLRRTFKDLYARLDVENNKLYDWVLSGYGNARNFHQKPIRIEKVKSPKKKTNLS
jgi:hypothetical protein